MCDKVVQRLATTRRPPAAAWLLVGRIDTTIGLTVRAQAAMAMWCMLRDFGLVDTGGELAVKDILGVTG